MLFKNKKKKINVLNLSGIIASSGKRSINFANTRDLINKAFVGSSKNTVVALVINSPGGSPVQSEMIGNFIQSKAKQTNIEVITFVEEVAASGGYWLALSANEIYALSKSSIVGSLGVVSSGFGLEDFIAEYKINRRVYTAGTKKVSMDMFSKVKAEDEEHLKALLNDVHENFKLWVLKNRSHKLKIEQDDLFTGEFWTASQGLNFGLVDGIVANMEDFFKDKYGQKTIFNYIKQKKGFFSGFSLTKQIQAALDGSIETLENKLKQHSINSKYDIK